MDYNHVWTNTTEKPPSTMLENNFSNVPAFVPESFCVAKNSFRNNPCYNSPQCSRFLKKSPEPYMPGDINQNIRYHPYHSTFTPLERTAYRTRNTRHFYEGNGPEMEIKDYYSQVKYQQAFEMHPKIYKAQCSRAPNHLKSNQKKKWKKQLKTKNVISNTVSTPCIDYKNCDIAVTPNYSPAGEILIGNKTENESIKPEATSDKNYLDRKNYFHEGTKANDTNMNTFMTNLNMASDFPNCATKEMDLNVGNQNVSFVDSQREDFNTELLSENATNLNMASDVPNCATKEMDLSAENQNLSFVNNQREDFNIELFSENAINLNMASDFPNCETKESDLNVGNQKLSFVNNQREDFNTELLFTNATANMELIDLLSMNNSDQTGYQATHIIIPDKMNSETQNIQLGSFKNTGTESYCLKSIFDEKDENGQDFVIFLANSEINQESPQNDIITTSVDDNNLEIQNKLAITNKPTENIINDEDFIDFSSLTQQILQGYSKESEDMFFSNTVDYASEETVVTSKYLNTEKVKNKDDKSTEKKHKENVDLTAEAKFITSDFAQEASTSKQSESIPTSKKAKIKSSHKKCINKVFKSKPYKQQWKRRFQWKSNEPLNNFRNAYFRKFMKRVKLENEHMMMNDMFWEMYRIILYKVGGNVMQTIHEILPMLIRKSNL